MKKTIRQLEGELIEANDALDRVHEIAYGVGQLKSELIEALHSICTVADRGIGDDESVSSGEPRRNGLFKDAVGYAVNQRKKRKLGTKLTKAESDLARAQERRDTIKSQLDSVS